MSNKETLEHWTNKYWRLIKNLRKRPQGPELSVMTGRFLRECPDKFTDLRKKVEEYENNLLNITVNTSVI